MVKIVVRCEMLFSKKSFHKKKKKEPLQRRYSSDPNDLKCKLNIYVAAAPTLWGVKIFIAKTHNELSHDDEWTVWWAGIFHSGTNPPPPPKKNNNIFLHQNWANVAVGLLGETCAAPHYWIYWVESKRRPFTCLPLLKRCSTSRMWSSYCTALNTLRYILLNATIIHNSTFRFYF